jgi:hypothetical protein
MNLKHSEPEVPAQHPLKLAHLVAMNSPFQAFYRIWIEKNDQLFRVCKASGARGKVWHQQVWEVDSMEEAEELFIKRLRSKTNQERCSRRKYRLGYLLPPDQLGDV